MKKFFVIMLLISNFSLIMQPCFAIDTIHPDFAEEFLGKDKFENYNRKMFGFNQKLNKYAIRPLHILWASIMPEYGMDRINGITNNIEFPIRLMSSLIQRDFTAVKNEGIRFFTNTIFGLGGMYDPAKRFLKIEQSKEDMEQALASCNIKPGPFFVLPVLSFTSIRGLFGKLLDTAFNPTSYIGSPVMAAIKAGLTINRTSYLQTLLTMVESTYADPYEITKKAYGINNYMKQKNYDRIDLVSNLKKEVNEPNVASNYREEQKEKPKENTVKMDVTSEIIAPNTYYIDTDFSEEIFDELIADIKLPKYNPQCPVVDSMRTALFNVPEAEKSMWSELSLWNRSFSNRIKTASVNFTEGKDDYNYRYILQKDKQNSPLVIIYPSIGEGILSSHSVMLGKIFYDAGYSVLIQGSHFQWEFVKSMPDGYYPGLPNNDAKILRELSSKIINQIEQKHNCNFGDKVFIGTSLGAVASLFVGALEYENNTLGNAKFLSICPPPNLIYAIRQIDNQSEAWDKSPEDFKQKVAAAAAKVVKFYQGKDDIKFEINNLPFTEEEGNMITGFIMHQKLSDLIFTLEHSNAPHKDGIYDRINNMKYEDYVKKYLVSSNEQSVDDLSFSSSLEAIKEYLEKGDNFKIYHSLNDYLAERENIRNLKKLTGNKTVIIDNGAHLGFLYRKEFINNLKDTIALN